MIINLLMLNVCGGGSGACVRNVYGVQCECGKCGASWTSGGVCVCVRPAGCSGCSGSHSGSGHQTPPGCSHFGCFGFAIVLALYTI